MNNSTANAATFVNKTDEVLKVLLSGKVITARDAAFDFNIFSLPQTIARLRHRKIPVRTMMIKVTNLDGKVTKYGENFMTTSDIATYYAAKGVHK